MKTTDMFKMAAILVGAAVIIYFVARLVVSLLAILLPIAIVGGVAYLAYRYFFGKGKKNRVA